MLIKGLQKTTAVDFPGKVACIVFTAGCNLLCSYCHNPDLVNNFKDLPALDEDDFFDFLEERKDWLDGVVICGGEPTIHPDLPQFMKRIKDAGFLVKLDTNGMNPQMIRRIIDEDLVDYIAMDIKAPLGKYPLIVGKKIDSEKIAQSVKIIIDAGKTGKFDYEFRTTVVPGLLDQDDIEQIAVLIKGAKKYVIQQFRNDVVLDASLKDRESYPKSTLQKFKKHIAQYLSCVEIRNAG